MKLKESRIYKFSLEILDIIISKDRIKELAGIPLYSNALYLLIASVSSALLGFIFWIIVARFYDAADVGIASATIAAMGLVGSFSRLGLETGLVRFLRQNGEDTKSTINSVFTIGLLSSIAASLIFIAELGLWSPALVFIRENPLYLAAFVVFTMASVLSVFVEHAFIAARHSGFTASKSLIFSLLKIPIPIALAGLMKDFDVFTSWGISLLAALFISIFLFLPRAQPGYRFGFVIKTRIVKDMLRFSFANYLSAIFWGAPGVVVPIMIINILGAELNAYFYIAWALGGVLIMIPTAVATSLFAEGSYDDTNLMTYIRRSLKMSFVLLIPAVILVVLVADKLLLLFGGLYSESATSLLRLLSVASLPLAVNVIYLNIKRVQKDLKPIVGLTAFMALLTLILNYFLLPGMGINGAGIAWLVGQGVTALWVTVRFFFKWKTLKIITN
jgi:O-antigen/teichoic acid export membrane protein